MASVAIETKMTVVSVFSPVSPAIFAAGDNTEDHTNDDKSAERRLIAVLREDKKNGGEEGKTRSEIRGNLPLAENEIEQGADSIEKQHCRWVDVKEDGDEHR